jgi:predicted 3-demethylubiquinone-9 3-methyltransferase (glyoxalase superfamily)
MPACIQRITPLFWFNDEAAEAVVFYTSVFNNSRIRNIARHSKESAQAVGNAEGSVMAVAFELDGQAFTALNGGPRCSFNRSISLVINCQSQEEVDHYSNRLCEGGDGQPQQCGWLKDRFGVSWQVVPTLLVDLLNDVDSERTRRVMAAVLQMKKIDLETLQQAAA